MLWHLALVFQSVSSVEELANVTTDVVLESEETTRMLTNEPGDIEDEVIEDHKLISFLKSVCEVPKCNSRANVALEWLLLSQSLLMVELQYSYYQNPATEMNPFEWYGACMFYINPVMVHASS
jgi:hypothetical protein